MIKAARKMSENAELARAFEDIDRAPNMSMEQFFAKDEQKRAGMRMFGALRERESAKQCVALIRRRGAARKMSENAELARAFEDIVRAPTYEQCIASQSMKGFFAKDEQKRAGMRMFGALRERESAEQCVALIRRRGAARKSRWSVVLARTNKKGRPQWHM